MDKRISFIVPVYKTEDFLDRCLRSLIDQDWKNKEIVCILDGPNPKAEKTIKFLKKAFPEVDLSYKVIAHGGACRARNAGAEIANGQILSFFNSDYVALPGMIRTWMEGFEDNPEADFVYGGYEYTNRSINPWPGEEFDAYKLECYNYIDCGSPIKAEVFKPWDENCKSLQDWDFFLRIVKAGAKGKWLKGVISYAAEPPRVGGLSNDSSQNWLDRVAYVKKNHNIPQRDICICSYGAPRHALNVAKMLNADYSYDPGYKPHNYKLIYLIGCYTGKDKNFSNLNAFVKASKDCKKVIHWVGADIYWLRNLSFVEVKYLMPKFQKEIHYHFVECEQMQEEMASYGLKTEILPIPPPKTYDLLPLPEEFTVGLMKTEVSDFDKYCGNLMDEVMAAMPHVKFKVFGDGKCKRDLPNVENMGYVDMSSLIDKCSCFLRIVRHDGMMMAANEFVMAGRDAITNLKMPYMEFIDTSVDSTNWDRFGAGFNIYNYPDTKTRIINKIIEVKEGRAGNKDRSQAKEYYEKLLDKNVFIEKVRGLA